MTKTVINTIEHLADEFTQNPLPLESRVKLDNPFLHAFNLLRSVEEDKRDEAVPKAFRFFREERHYALNITTLLYYFLYYFKNYRNDKHVQWDFRSRLTLDVEQLATNTRSFLDSTYKLALLFSDESESAKVKSNKRKSFGKFAEWAKLNKMSFSQPLSFLTELIPWGLTIRKVRDDFIHGGREAEPFWDRDDVYFYPSLTGRNQYQMPDIFYCSKHSRQGIKPIYLRKFVVYVAAPVIALELGRYLDELFSARYGSSHNYEYPFKADSNVQDLYNFIIQNKECLEGTIYESSYFN